jgi:hypothetical protein
MPTAAAGRVRHDPAKGQRCRLPYQAQQKVVSNITGRYTCSKSAEKLSFKL